MIRRVKPALNMPMKLESVDAGVVRAPVRLDTERHLVHPDRRNVDDGVDVELLSIVLPEDIVLHRRDAVEIGPENGVIGISTGWIMRIRSPQGVHDDIMKGNVARDTQVFK